MNDHYERIANVIRYLDEHYVDQPNLDALAAVAGLSRFHFHRLFAEWAGITPKDFVQCLTVEHAKQLLRSGESALTTALASGLSGPGRLHSLCVTMEAASPGELKSGGAGWTVDAGFAASPFGTCLIAQSARGICYLAFVESDDLKTEWTAVQREWPNACVKRNDPVAEKLSANIFAADAPSRRPLSAFVKGTPFQVRVWRALLQVPPGHLISYGRLAAAVGESRAARAVGSAVGQNPIAYLIPCHRVIRSTGALGEYRWGRLRKRVMLAWESHERPA